MKRRIAKILKRSRQEARHVDSSDSTLQVYVDDTRTLAIYPGGGTFFIDRPAALQKTRALLSEALEKLEVIS